MNRLELAGLQSNFLGIDTKSSPERNLLVAMIQRAFCDIADDSEAVEPEERRDAIRWILSKNIYSFTFLWTCEQLDFDKVREEVQRLAVIQKVKT